MGEPVGNGPRIDIPGNSHAARQGEPVSKGAEERVRPSKVIEGKVVLRKPPWYRRAAHSMIADDASTVSDFVFTDVVIPAVRNLIFDIITQGSSRVLFGTARNARMQRPNVGTGAPLKIQYNNLEQTPRQLTQEARSRHDFEDVVLETRGQAVTVIQELQLQVEKYGSATVQDLYDILGVSGGHTDQKWGWTDLSSADIRQDRRGFLLDLPRTQPLSR